MSVNQAQVYAALAVAMEELDLAWGDFDYYGFGVSDDEASVAFAFYRTDRTVVAETEVPL